MKKPINLLYIIESLNNGGAEVLTIRLTERIDRKRFNPMICSLSDQGPLRDILEEKNITYFTLGKKEGKDFGLPSRIRKLLKAKQIDIVHTHNQGPLLYTFLATRFLKHVVLIHTEHINLKMELSYSTRHMIFHWILLRFINGFISIAQHLSDHFVKNYNLSKNKIITIPNGIDVAKFEFIQRTQTLKEELGFPEDTIIIGNISALREQKDHKTLISSMEIVKKQLPEAKLVIAGGGVLEKTLKQFVREKDLEEHVVFLGYRSDVANLLSGFDIFALSSLYEGLPLCLLEAMAAGLPVVATDVVGSNELIDNKYDGILIRAKDPDALGRALIELISDDKLRKKLGANGKNTVKHRYDFDKSVKNYENFYEDRLNLR